MAINAVQKNQQYLKRETVRNAVKFADRHNAIYFFEGEWLNKLFVPDVPEGLLGEPMNVVGAWASEKYQRCRDQIWLVCKQLLKQNISIILDGSAAKKEQSNLIRKKVIDNNIGFQFHYITSNYETRKNRVFKRNEDRGNTYSLEVTPQKCLSTWKIYLNRQQAMSWLRQ